MAKRLAVFCCICALGVWGCDDSSSSSSSDNSINCANGNADIKIAGLIQDDLRNPVVPDEFKELIAKGYCPKSIDATQYSCKEFKSDDEKYKSYNMVCSACDSSEQINCNGECTNGLTDKDNCGKCGNACDASQKCENGYCVCDNGKSTCGNDVCSVDLMNDAEHCGKCETACSEEESCLNGECRKCVEGEFKCDGKRSLECKNNEWKMVDACNFKCDETTGKCDSCVDNARFCSEDKTELYTCKNGAWDFPKSCKTYKCGAVGESFDCLICNPGDTACSIDGKTLQNCDGVSWNPESCSYKCADKKCIECDSSSANRCDDENKKVVKCDGNQWVDGEDCPLGCTDGKCNECEDGAVKCDENGVNQMICKGHHWEVQTCQEGCANNKCNDKICDEGQKRCSPDGAKGIDKCSDNTYLLDSTCGDNEVCKTESVACGCDDGFDKCGDSCVDLNTDKKNCGSCNNNVGSFGCANGVACVENKSMVTSSMLSSVSCCSANDSFYLYLGVRADCNVPGMSQDYYCFSQDDLIDFPAPQCLVSIDDVSHLSDPNACGTNAGNFVKCDANSVCGDGLCSCKDGFELCNGVCVDIKNDPNNCGACGNAIDTSILTCSMGIPVCSNSALTYCGDRCVNTQIDSNNCGACGVVVGQNQKCSGGKLGCKTKYTDCDDSAALNCVDLNTDNEHCGACHNKLDAEHLCSAGVAVCKASGYLDCDGVCYDVMSDTNNCGACGEKTIGDGCRDGGRCVPHDDFFTPRASYPSRCCELDDTEMVLLLGIPGCYNEKYSMSMYGDGDDESLRYCISKTDMETLKSSQPQCYVDIANDPEWSQHLIKAESCGLDGNYSDCTKIYNSKDLSAVCDIGRCCFESSDVAIFGGGPGGTTELSGMNKEDFSKNSCCDGHAYVRSSSGGTFYYCTDDPDWCQNNRPNCGKPNSGCSCEML